jgi:DNA-binding MarR family transcriptional regulator
MSGDSVRISRRQFETLSNFRYELRRYMRYSEQITRKHGVTPLQYQLLLHLKGFPGRDWATVSELAERLQAKHHGVVALITRCEKAKLVERRSDSNDRRRVYVHLTPKGEGRLARLADLHRRELVLLEKRFFVPKREDFGK